MNTRKSISAGEWYFVHALASLAFATLLLMFSLDLYLAMASRTSIDAPAFVRLLMVVGVIAVFWLWIRMLIDFFRERPPRHPVL